MGNSCSCCQTESEAEQSPLLADNAGSHQYSATREDNGGDPTNDQNNVDQTSNYLVPTPSASKDHSLQNSVENQADLDKRIEQKTNELQKKLKFIYNKAVLPHVSWLKKGEELPIRDYFVPFQLTSSGSEVTLQDLFRTNAKRILLEGHQGYGKSTVCYKILLDWASATSYDNFKLVFVLPLRNLNQIQAKDIVEALATIYSADNHDQFRAVLDANTENTLFVLDGLDELPEDLESIKQILSVNPKSTLLVTCRTGYKYSPNSVELLDKKNYDKCVEIHGISTENRRNFLEKFFPTEVTDAVLTNLESEPLLNSLSELFHCPLFLGLLGISVSEETEPKFTTKTNLFKQFVNSAIKLSIDTDNEEFDIFDEKCLSAAGFSEFIRGFSKLLVPNLPDKSVFASDKFTHEMHRLGLMTRHNEVYILKERTYYEIFHGSLMEFLVAFRLVAEFKGNQYSFDKDFMEYINTIVVENGHSSLVLPFLIGLLEDKAEDFFVQMAPFASVYSSQEILVWNMMFESRLKDGTIESYKNFLPNDVHQSEDSSLMPFYLSSKHEELIKLGIESGRIEYIHYINSNMKLPSDTPIPVLEINANGQTCIDALQNLNIRNLLSKCDAINDTEEANKVFNSLTSIPTIEKHTFKLTNLQHFNDCRLENIQNLICEFKDEDSMAGEKIISSLQAEENKMEKLQLVFRDSSTVENVKKILDHISRLTFFHFENNTKENLEFDMELFAPHQEKCLVLHNVKLMQSDKQWNLHYLDIDDSNPETATALTSITMKVLSCTTRLLCTLHKIEPREWAGYESVQEIVLKVDDSALKPQVWHNLSSFQNLRTLAIYLQKRSNKQYWGIDEIQESILSLSINDFIIWAVQCNVQSVASFCNKIKEYILEKNKCNFQNITLFVGNATDDDLAELRSVFADLLQCVKSGKLKSFSICCAHLSMWPIVLRQQVIDTSVLSIEHDVCGSKDDDSFTSKLHFREYFKMCNRFKITLK